MSQETDELFAWLLTHAGIESESTRLMICGKVDTFLAQPPLTSSLVDFSLADLVALSKYTGNRMYAWERHLEDIRAYKEQGHYHTRIEPMSQKELDEGKAEFERHSKLHRATLEQINARIYHLLPSKNSSDPKLEWETERNFIPGQLVIQRINDQTIQINTVDTSPFPSDNVKISIKVINES